MSTNQLFKLSLLAALFLVLVPIFFHVGVAFFLDSVNDGWGRSADFMDNMLKIGAGYLLGGAFGAKANAEK